MKKMSAQSSSSSAVVDREQLYTLQGHHTMDVLDLDWQPLVVDHHSSYTLASTSIDNNLIIIWTRSCPDDSLVSPSKILKGHDSYVKGLAFDPLGRYVVGRMTSSILSTHAYQCMHA